MNRYSKKRSGASYAPEVERIELSQSHTGLRLILAVLALLVGAATIAYSVRGVFSRNSGWNEIAAETSEMSCAGDFSFLYELGRGEESASREYKNLVRLYSDLAVKAYQQFSLTEDPDGVHNLHYINAHPNEDISVDAMLMQALRLMTAQDGRFLYLAPIYEDCRNLFSCDTPAEAAALDPRLDAEEAAFVSEVLGFVNSGAVSLCFPAENTVRLNVTEDYLSFAAESEIEQFLDFGVFTNAVIADAIADGLIENGYFFGYLRSCDGFCRGLGTETQLEVSVPRRLGSAVQVAGTAVLSGIQSLVILRDFPVSSDAYNYFDLGNGQYRTAYIDPADGLCKSATDYLMCWSDGCGCTELLLRTLPVFASDNLDPQALSALSDSGIRSLWGDGNYVCCNNADLSFMPETASGFVFELRS